MMSVFDSYLAVSEREAELLPASSVEERALMLEDRVAAHLAIFDAMDDRIGNDGVTEAHRPMIALYQRWMKAARQLVVHARQSRAAGRPIKRIDELVCDINLAKFIADDFDHTVQVNERVKRGQPQGPGRPLDEFMNELRPADRAGG